MAADLGTVGTALSRSPPPPAPPPDSTADADAPSSPESPDTSGVRDVLGRNKEQITALQGRLQSIDRRSDALQPPVMEKAPKPPETHDTPIADRWGSVAMMLAGFGGLLTRQPLTASLNAMAAVNHAFNEGDAAQAKSAFDTWKVENENAIKMNDFHVKAYEGAIRKVGTDRTGALAEIRATAAALKDDVVISLLDSGQTDRALQMLGARATGAGQFSERAEKVAAHTELKLAYRRAHPNAPPEELARADLDILKDKDPDAPAKPETPGLYEERLEKSYVDEQTATWKAKPENAGKEPTAQQQIEWKHQATAGGKPVTGAAAREKDADTAAVQKFRDAHQGRDPAPEDESEMARLRSVERQHQANQAGRTAVMLQRTLTSAADAVTDIKNIVDLPMSLSTGVFGGRTQGHGLMAATKEALTNTVTSEEVQSYNAALAGIGRAMGGLATGGLAVSDDVMKSFDQLQIKAGDTYLTKLRKIATLRQNVDNAIDSFLTNPALTDAQTKQAEKLQREVSEAVPFTVHDVNQVQFSNKKGVTVADFARKSGVVPAAGAVPEITDKAAYDALPPGAHFRKQGDPPGGYRTKQ